jgi:GNAT superfamily N-acetyltransferase
MQTNIQLRLAVPADVPPCELIDVSVRGLQARITPDTDRGALKTVFGVDSQLIADGTYIVAEAIPSESQRDPQEKDKSASPIVGCGGWSKRKTLYGSDHWTGREDRLLNPKCDAAKIRAFFIHPDWARRGIGGMILEACGGRARGRVHAIRDGCDADGAKLFGVKGYVAVKTDLGPLTNGEVLPVIHMEKRR